MSAEPRSEDPVPLKGMRHLAIRVRDMGRSRIFYENLLGLRLVWEPDQNNVYLSSGTDNLALHTIPKEEAPHYHQDVGQFLDHFGFIVESPELVETMAKKMEDAGVRILVPPRAHRDGSCSFYMADPDGNKIQILYEPSLSSEKGRYILGAIRSPDP